MIRPLLLLLALPGLYTASAQNGSAIKAELAPGATVQSPGATAPTSSNAARPNNGPQNAPNFRLLRSAGKLPAMAYGLGEDRLGAAKMGYLDTNVLLKVVDSTKDQYRVQLSRHRHAYLDKVFTKPDSAQVLRPFYLTGSILAKGDSLADVVNIGLTEKLPYRTWMDIHPSRIVVEIFGVQSNTNWVTQLSSLQEVKNVYLRQTEEDVVQIIIELKHQQHWGYSVGYTPRGLNLRIKRQPNLTDPRKLFIAIDAGHGGTNTGASGVVLKASEKEQTLLFAKALEKTLKKAGFKHIVMTRHNDTSFDNKDRILFLQEKNPDLLISLHLNSSSKPEIKGVSTYYQHIGFRSFSQALLQRMLDLKLDEFGNIGHFNFALNQPTEFPNALVEIAFLSNAEDEKRIVKPSFHQAVAEKLKLGILQWAQAVKAQSLVKGGY